MQTPLLSDLCDRANGDIQAEFEHFPHFRPFVASRAEASVLLIAALMTPALLSGAPGLSSVTEGTASASS